VAQRACEMMQLPRDQVVFTLDGRVLEAQATVEECLLTDGDEVEMTVNEEFRREVMTDDKLINKYCGNLDDGGDGNDDEGEGGEAMAVKLRDAKGKTVQVDVHADDTIAQVIEAYKRLVPTEEGAKLSLEFDGDLCSENATLSALGIEPDDMLEVAVRK
jgi:hypothetical protein